MDSDSSTTSDSDNELPSLIAPVLLLFVEDQQQGPRSNNCSQAFVNDLLNCGNPHRIQTILWMRLDTFLALRDWLVEYSITIISIYYSRGEVIHIYLDR
jgi:hypothetical protein